MLRTGQSHNLVYQHLTGRRLQKRTISFEDRLAYNHDKLLEMIASRQGNLTQEQNNVFQRVLALVNQALGHFIFVDALGKSHHLILKNNYLFVDSDLFSRWHWEDMPSPLNSFDHPS